MTEQNTKKMTKTDWVFASIGAISFLVFIIDPVARLSAGGGAELGADPYRRPAIVLMTSIFAVVCCFTRKSSVSVPVFTLGTLSLWGLRLLLKSLVPLSAVEARDFDSVMTLLFLITIGTPLFVNGRFERSSKGHEKT